MKKQIKTGLIFGLTLTMFLALCACGNQQGGNAAEAPAAAEAAVEEAAEAAEAAVEEAAEAAEETVEEAVEAAEAAVEEAAEAVGTDEYADYVGSQFSGKDPWGGDLAVTIRSIRDGKLEWTFTDTFDEVTLYQEVTDSPFKDGVAEYHVAGADIEDENRVFDYSGTITLKDGKLVLTFAEGAVTMNSPQGGSSARHAEALEEAAKTIELEKNVRDK